MYAIVSTGGKQYNVTEGQLVYIEKLNAEAGEAVVFDQVLAIVDSVKEYVRKTTGHKVYGMDGVRNTQWVAMDYGDVLVHVFLPEVRDFYNLEHLWADAKLTSLPDID